MYDAIKTQNLATIIVILNPKHGFDVAKMIQLIEYESPPSAHKYKPMIETICWLTTQIQKGYECLVVILKRLFGDGTDSTSANSKEIKFKPRITREAIERAVKHSKKYGGAKTLDLVKRYLVIGNYSQNICKMVDRVEYNHKIVVGLQEQILQVKSFKKKDKKLVNSFEIAKQ